jgi:hypothetical protein
MDKLKELLDRIAARKLAHNPRSIALVVDEAGKQLTLGRLQDHFARARAAAGIAADDFQFRNLRRRRQTRRMSPVWSRLKGNSATPA